MQVALDKFMGKCSCGHSHSISVRQIFIEPNASQRLESFLSPYHCPVFICDTNTRKATGSVLAAYYKKYAVIELSPKDLHADNKNVNTLLKSIDDKTDLLIAVGSGTVHDLTRYCASHRGIPFISMPTAASVDGFVSTVAAMTWNGLKKTLPAAAPIIVLADTEIFSRAPYRLTASGISDLMGKYTALADWEIAHLVTGEHFCRRIYDLELQALTEVEQVLGDIQSGNKDSMEKLMYALILSGLAMQMMGNSRPASGAEHHISHLWEMHVVNDPIEALHGEKVSVGLLLTLEKYQKILGAIRSGTCRIVDHKEFETSLLKETFGKEGLYEGILEENGENILAPIDLNLLEKQLPGIAAILEKLPTYDCMRTKLKKAGCTTSMQDLKLPDIKDLTLTLSPYVRRRLTLMRLSKLFELS